jgi:23S rRNA (adenine1618-N6)-methyltransferase
MAGKAKHLSPEKPNMHPRNAHRTRYDFAALIKTSPDLRNFLEQNEYQDLSVNFADPQAVLALNKALLKHFYGITHWDIPEGFLCPPIPGRADYIHYMADVLAETNNGVVPTGDLIKVLDIGVGANCIYPLIGHKAYGWSFVGSEIDPVAVRSAKSIVGSNKLTDVIDIRQQISATDIFNGIINPGEKYDLVVCNPPFHASAKEADASTDRKQRNLGFKEGSPLNFGGQNTELWTPGGEARFLNKMISESVQYAQSVRWFSSLISKKETLAGCYKSLDYFKAAQVKTIQMAQGQKVSRILAWSFNPLTS